jgi:predicted deacetylase
MSATRQLVVSVHDVAPSTRAQVERMLDQLAALGVTRRSLLVIPNFRGASPIDRDEPFCAWLRARSGTGDEIVLHGYEHIAVGAPRTARERFKNRWLTQSEGEFLTLDYGAALARIARGAAMLKRANLEAHGFVAPAWLITPGGLRAALESGFEYSNSYASLIDLARQRSYTVPSLVFGPGHLNEDLGVALQRYVSRVMARCPRVRVVLHPPCVDHRGRFAHITSMIAEQAQTHQPVTYLDLLAGLRASPATAPAGRHAY